MDATGSFVQFKEPSTKDGRQPITCHIYYTTMSLISLVQRSMTTCMPKTNQSHIPHSACVALYLSFDDTINNNKFCTEIEQH